jgi:HD-GYP domain-containing protein (c-di-GMP phosphodiesterase class II)
MTAAVSRYILTVSTVFWVGAGVAAATGGSLPHHWTAVAPLLGAAIAAEALVVSRENSSASFSVAAHIATAILFGPLVAALVAATAVLLVDGARLGLRPAVWLNSAIFGAAIAAGGCAFLLAGGQVGPLTERSLVPVTLLILVRFFANEVLLAVAITLDTGARLGRVLWDDLRDLAGSAVGEGSLGVLVAFGMTGRHWLILPFLVPLLAALYRAQLNLERLRRETSDVLNTFAGVVDQRDPNTALHSRRVADFVARFTSAIQLPEREAARLVEAARYHDLGKINVDESTLSREGRLSPEELRRIRSHPALSARLLSPFHFAQEIALFAELHHERYDGGGYYAVPQREIPVEAHVLIVADSFDAMTSARAYRPALTTDEAVAELRDKAGAQFHPLVAQAFAAMIEDTDPQLALGRAQLGALQAEFSRVRTLDPAALWRLATPRIQTLALAAAALVGLGIRGTPVAIEDMLLGSTVVSGLVGLAVALRQRRRSRSLREALEAGRRADEALQAAGVESQTGWVHGDETRGSHLFTQDDGAAPMLPDDVSRVTALATRVIRQGSYEAPETGRHYTLSQFRDGAPRLAVCTSRPLTAFERRLVEEAAAWASPTVQAGAGHEAERAAAAPVPAIGVRRLQVELNAFDNVRKAAGQLTAEQVIAQVANEIRSALRGGDSCEQTGDDQFTITLQATHDGELDAIIARLRTSIWNVPLPRRVARLEPSFAPIDSAPPDLRPTSQLRAAS